MTLLVGRSLLQILNFPNVLFLFAFGMLLFASMADSFLLGGNAILMPCCSWNNLQEKLTCDFFGTENSIVAIKTVQNSASASRNRRKSYDITPFFLGYRFPVPNAWPITPFIFRCYRSYVKSFQQILPRFELPFALLHQHCSSTPLNKVDKLKLVFILYDV